MQVKLIKFNKIVIYTLTTFLLIFVLLIIFNINGSSISYWNNIVGKKENTETMAGSPKAIRSDEYAVQTPFFFSQIKNNFSNTNDSIGPETTPVVMGLPAKDLSAIFRPQLYGFYFLGEERGFSYFWNYLSISIIVAFFLLLLVLTKNNYFISLTLSLTLFFSSFIQWWFSTQLTLLIAYMSAVVLSFSYMYFSNNKRNKIVFAGLLTYFLIAFCLILYPPFQVPLVIIGLTLVLGLIVQNNKDSKRKARKEVLANLPYILPTLLIVGSFLAYFYVSNIDLIRIVKETVYPGKRAETGGNFDITRYYSGLYNFIMTPARVPRGYGNISSASNFMLLAPMAIIFNFRNKIKKENIIFWLLSLLFIVYSLWIVVGMPSILAKITFFSLIPPNRMFIGLGVLNFLILAIYLSGAKPTQTKKSSLICFLILILFFAGLAMGFNRQNYNFLSNQVILISILGFSALSILLYRKKSIAFTLILTASIVLPSLFINPILIGTKSLTETELAKFVETKAYDGKKWAVFNSISLPNYFKAQGVSVINGVNYAPDFEKLKILDPEGKNRDIYNRYAYIAFLPGNGKPEFELVQQDVYSIKVDPCGEELKMLNVEYIVIQETADKKLKGALEFNTSCLLEIYYDQISGIKIYKRK